MLIVLNRSEAKLAGKNNIHFGPKFLNYLTLPIIPATSTGDLVAQVKEGLVATANLVVNGGGSS